MESCRCAGPFCQRRRGCAQGRSARSPATGESAGAQVRKVTSALPQTQPCDDVRGVIRDVFQSRLKERNASSRFQRDSDTLKGVNALLCLHSFILSSAVCLTLVLKGSRHCFCWRMKTRLFFITVTPSRSGVYLCV